MVRLTNRHRNLDGVYRKKTASDNFYSDVDASGRRFIGFWAISIIILLMVFFTLIGLAIAIRQAKIDPDTLDVEKEDSVNLVSFSERLSTISSSGQTMLLFNASELAKASGATESDFPLKNAKFIITKDNLYLFGKIPGSIVFWPVKIKIAPGVKDQKFYLTIPGDSLENIILPTGDKEKIENIFDQNINQPLLTKNLTASDIRLADNRIEFYVVKGAR